MDGYLDKHDFDWEYYSQKNQDLVKKGVRGLDPCYRHWITYGCHENRWVRSLSTGAEKQVMIKNGTKFARAPRTPLANHTTPNPIDLQYKIAIMIHVFDATMMRFFVSYLNYLSQSYSNDNFDIYFNIVEENNPYGGELRTLIKESIATIENPHVTTYYNENRGGDIGGFLLLAKRVVNSGLDYKYVIFAHSKTKSKWRIDLCHCLFNLPFKELPKMKDMGLISSKKWLKTFDPVAQPEEYRKFKYHLIDLCNTYELPNNCPFQFIAGTMFLTRIEVLQYIVHHEIDRIYLMLNRPESVDINWLNIVEEQRRDPKGTSNDFMYRIKYRKALLSDYMIEHTYERVIGLICVHLGYKVVGYNEA